MSPSPSTLILGLALSGAALFLVLHVVLRHRRRDVDLAHALKPYDEAPPREHRSVLTALSDGLGQTLDRLPKPKGYEAAIGTKLELAGWPLRASEFLAIRTAAGLSGVVVGAGLLRSWFFTLTLGVVGAYVPQLLLARGIDQRVNAFAEQLPETLYLLAASIEAGQGILQGMDAVARRSTPPTSTEFTRVLAEVRLGTSVDEALGNMSDRVKTEEFGWVVLTMNVQREVGGNLASVLRTLADTIRERDQLRRQVKVLSTEGRVSGLVLGALPVVVAFFLLLTNPGYIGVLVAGTVGRVAVLLCLALMALGAVWIRRIVTIEV